MSTSSAIPLTVIGGYLGAGKTTVLNEVLRSTTRRLAVLVNDFGEIDIDSSLIESHDGETISLANGCVCCSLADGFLTALQTVRAIDPPVEHVIVEASGVADPKQVAQWGHIPGFRLDGVVVVVDADAILDRSTDRYVGDTIRTQVRGADLVLLTKSDLVVDDAPVRSWITDHTVAPILDAPMGRVPLIALIGAGLEELADATIDRSPHPDHVTASIEIDGPIDDAALTAMLADRPNGLVRAKGVLRRASSPDRRTIVHVVGRRHELTRTAAWNEGEPSRMVAIARPMTPVVELDRWLARLAAD